MMKEGGKAWRNLKEVKSGGKSIILKETPNIKVKINLLNFIKSHEN